MTQSGIEADGPTDSPARPPGGPGIPDLPDTVFSRQGQK